MRWSCAFVFHIVDVIYYAYLFANVEPSLHPWAKSCLINMSDFFFFLLFLDLICKYFGGIISSMFIKDIGLYLCLLFLQLLCPLLLLQLLSQCSLGENWITIGIAGTYARNTDVGCWQHRQLLNNLIPIHLPPLVVFYDYFHLSVNAEFMSNMNFDLLYVWYLHVLWIT